MNLAIDVQGLTKYYGKARGIIDVSFQVSSGEIFGFIGPNGAGKSTTIRTILGLLSPTAGSACILGLDSREKHVSLMRKIGYLPGEAAFYPDMRVREVLTISSRLRGMDCTQNAKRLCERFLVEENKKINELSLGNRKKVGIVCAMQHDPELYILDEPTSGLDPLMQKEFFDLIEEKSRAGATVFLSSHVLSEIRRHCQRAAVIREGRLIACDTVEALSGSLARRVSLTGVSAAPALPGLRDVKTTDTSISFLYDGKMNALIAALSNLDIVDMTVAEPDLDETFLHFYEEANVK